MERETEGKGRKSGIEEERDIGTGEGKGKRKRFARRQEGE